MTALRHVLYTNEVKKSLKKYFDSFQWCITVLNCRVRRWRQKSTFNVGEITKIFLLKCGKEHVPSTYLATYSIVTCGTL